MSAGGVLTKRGGGGAQAGQVAEENASGAAWVGEGGIENGKRRREPRANCVKEMRMRGDGCGGMLGAGIYIVERSEGFVGRVREKEMGYGELVACVSITAAKGTCTQRAGQGERAGGHRGARAASTKACSRGLHGQSPRCKRYLAAVGRLPPGSSPLLLETY